MNLKSDFVSLISVQRHRLNVTYDTVCQFITIARAMSERVSASDVFDFRLVQVRMPSWNVERLLWR